MADYSWLDKYIEKEKEYYGATVHELIRDVTEALDKYGDAYFND